MTLYRQKFGLAKDPFNMTPDPDLLFMTEQHREALAGVAYAILDRKGFAVLIGPAGTGKTTLVTTVLQSLKKSPVQSSVILNPALSPAEFLEMVLLDFGIADIPASKAQRINIFQKFLLESHQKQKVCTVIVDEAHKLSPDVLEEIRLWTNFEFSDQKLLQIVLVGQPELRDVLNREDLRQLKQRIALRFTIAPLSMSEVAAYIQYRWSRSGAPAPAPITPEAVALVARASAGIPRVINAICDNALLLIFGRGLAVVSEDSAREACRELDVLPAPHVLPGPLAMAAKPTVPMDPIPMVAHAGTNGNGAKNGVAVAQVLQAATHAPEVVNFATFRTLDSYDPAHRRSLWSRLLGKNGGGN